MAGPSGPAYMRKDGYFMKAMKRRLLSLLLAMAMVCTLVPSALAAGNQLTVTVAVESADQTATANGYPLNTRVTLKATVTGYTEGTDGTLSYQWSGTGVSSSNSATTTVTSSTAQEINVSCTVTAIKEGTTTKSGSGNITVKFVDTTPSTTPVTGISLNKTSLSLQKGANETLNATITPDGASDKSVTWSSGDPSKVSVDQNGKVTANAVTTTPVTITAKANGAAQGDTVQATCSVTVTAAPQTTSITFAPTSLSLTAGGSAGNVTVTVKQGDTPVVGQTVTLGSVTSSPSTGVIASASLGTTTTTNASGQATITVTPGSIAGTAIIPVSCNGASQNLSVTVSGSTAVATLTPNSNTTPANGTTVYLDNWSDYNNANYRTFTLAPSLKVGGVDITAQSTVTYQWTLNTYNVQNNNVYNPNSYTLYSNNTYLQYGTTSNTLKCIATFSYTQDNVLKTASAEYTCYINTGYSNALATATVSTSTSSYALGDVDDAGKSSVVSQLDSYFYNKSGCYGLAYVRFTGTTQNNTYGSLNAKSNIDYYADRRSGTGSNTSYLADVLFYPGSSKGTVSFPIRAYYYTSNTLNTTNWVDGTITFTVTEDVSTGDITYTASIGDDVYFDMGDFEDLYYTKTSRGTLDRVTFTMPSGGYLYSDRNRLSSSNATCYVSPRSTENDLGSVYFSPTGTTASRAGTVRVGFTAYGNRSNVSGTVAITYLNGAAKDITYSTVGGSVTLDHQDFIDAYKEVTGKTAPSNLTIQFQEVPSNGTLTYTGGSRDVDLTKSNVRSNKYSTKTTGSYRLNQLTYTGTRGTDTIEYIAYSGSAAQFTGKVVFNGTAAVPTDVVVTYGSTGGQAVLFSQNDFVRANSAMSNAVKVRFVTPTNGTLTMNGANAAGIDIASSLLGSVSYKPKAGFNGTDRIIFAAYDSRNQLAASGSVNITVVGNTGTSTTTPGGVTDVSQFKDVSSTAWYRNDLATLVSQGIITGKGEGKFDPLGTVTYGEALKMILEACGYTATLGTGSNWAINYKNLAVSNGWISSSIDLNAAISRNATAELAARVLGVAPATGGSPFADEANAYAVALYYTNPQIFVGDNTTGKLLFKNGSPLLRQEVCAVICRVRNYHTQHTSNTMPDGI